jgi:hypothetical protein
MLPGELLLVELALIRAHVVEAANAVCVRGTTTFENAHRIVPREVLYPSHHWFGRPVYVHATIDKADDVVFRCTREGSKADRWLEVPAWMLDLTACPDADL